MARAEWQLRPLESEVEGLDAGVSVNADDRPHGVGEIGVLKTSALTGGDFDASENKAVLQRDRTRVRVSPTADSILVSRMNTPALVGESAYVARSHPDLFLPDRLWQLRFRNREECCVRWVAHYLQSHAAKTYISLNATGTSGSMKNLPKSRFLSMPIRWPLTPEQRRIAEILDTLDEAIRKTEQLIAKLKQVKQGLLHDLLTRGIDENGELRDPERHPEQFKKSPLGRIPKQWEIRRLSNVGSWLSGGTPSKANPAYWSGSLPWVSPKDMKRLLLERTQDTITEEGAAAGSRVVPANSVFIVVRGMILAHTFPVCLSLTRMSFNQDVKAIIPCNDINGRYLAHWFIGNSEQMLQIVTESTHGTKRIDLNDLHRQNMTVPSPGEQELILQVLESFDVRLSREKLEADKYRLLKQGLMEDLLTGRVRVTALLNEPYP